MKMAKWHFSSVRNLSYWRCHIAILALTYWQCHQPMGTSSMNSKLTGKGNADDDDVKK